MGRSEALTTKVGCALLFNDADKLRWVISVTNICFIYISDEVPMPEHEIGAPFRSLEQNGSVRSLIAIEIMKCDLECI